MSSLVKGSVSDQGGSPFEGRADAIRKRTKVSSDEMAGVTTWSPSRDADNSEFKIPHKLGRRPKGFWFSSGRLVPQLVSTPEQRSRWDSKHIYATFASPYSLWGQVPGVILSGQAVDQIEISRDLDAAAAEMYFGFAVMANQGDPGGEYPLRSAVYFDGSPATSRPYDQFRVSTMGGATVSADLSFLMSVYVKIKASDKFILQVY